MERAALRKGGLELAEGTGGSVDAVTGPASVNIKNSGSVSFTRLAFGKWRGAGS
jgi:hypothetical protein